MSSNNGALAKIIAQAQRDKNFCQQLLSNPATVLSSEGYNVPKGVQLHIMQETDRDKYIVIPSGQMSTNALNSISGGAKTKKNNNKKGR